MASIFICLWIAAFAASANGSTDHPGGALIPGGANTTRAKFAKSCTVSAHYLKAAKAQGLEGDVESLRAQLSEAEANLDRYKQGVDVSYFRGNENLGFHHEMLVDSIRTETYRSAMDAERFKGKIVLDVGTGTGVLAIFAARAGAKMVYAVDASGMAAVAEQVVMDNNLTDRIQVFHSSKSRYVELFSNFVNDVLSAFWIFWRAAVQRRGAPNGKSTV